MPKGVNSKAEAARERKAASKADNSSKSAKEAEDAYWRSQGEGSKSKAQAKKEEQEKQRLEAAAKKAEAKRLAEMEEQELSKPKPKKAGPAAVGKVRHVRSRANLASRPSWIGCSVANTKQLIQI
jgi:hypothetical protein